MRILEAGFFSNDLPSTADFCREALGLTLAENNGETVTALAGSSRIVFRKSLLPQPACHYAFNIPFSIVDDAARFMSGKVTLIEHEGKPVVDFSAWNARAFYFRDNLGNIVELIGRKDIADAGGEFSPASIECVSEVAVVTDSVGETCRDLTLKTGLAPYDRQPVLYNFAAMGDANGLLILSSENRHWFPTGILTKKYPVNIKADISGTPMLLEFNHEDQILR